MTLRQKLERDGFAVCPQMCTAAQVAALQEVTDGRVQEMAAAEARLYRYQGSDLPLHDRPCPAPIADLVGSPALAAMWRRLQMPAPRLLSGYIVSKPPGGPAMYWHQDWPLWPHPISARPLAPMLGVLVYLRDTHIAGGALRVIPGSHTRRLPLHAALVPPHTPASYRLPPGHVSFATHRRERDVCVRAGDAVLVDARLLHATHPNHSQSRRTCLTLWYLPDFDDLPQQVQAAIMALEPAVARFGADPLLGPWLPRYHGSAAPAAFDRRPGRWLR